MVYVYCTVPAYFCVCVELLTNVRVRVTVTVTRRVRVTHPIHIPWHIVAFNSCHDVTITQA